MKTVKASELSSIMMVGHNEKKYSIVIDGQVLKQWVGIGWIEIGVAQPHDRKKYPTIKR